MKKVLIHPATYQHLNESIDRIFEIFPLDLAGKKVLLKPNVLRASTSAEGIVTNPAVLAAVIEKVESFKPASLIVGDNPGVFGYGDNEECFRSTGLLEAAGKYYRNIGTDARRVAFQKYGQESVTISADIMDADIVISLPKFKTHGLTVLSGAIKNSYGFLPGAQKAKLHSAAGNPERFNELIAEIFSLRIPDLFIVDAVTGMEGNGPASPDLREIGMILGSDNAVALDSVIAQMMGCDPSRLRFLTKAREMGLGDFDPSNIELIGTLTRIPGFKLPPLGGNAVYTSTADLMVKKTQVLPEADPSRCSGCGSCVAHCPVSAIVLKSGLPVVQSDRCITCFCCQEVCPEKAITLKQIVPE